MRKPGLIFLTSVMCLLLIGCGNRRVEYVCEGGKTFIVEYDRKGTQAILLLDQRDLLLTNIAVETGVKFSNGRFAVWTEDKRAQVEIGGVIMYEGQAKD